MQAENLHGFLALPAYLFFCSETGKPQTGMYCGGGIYYIHHADRRGKVRLLLDILRTPPGAFDLCPAR
jgi:hypothetical protein